MVLYSAVGDFVCIVFKCICVHVWYFFLGRGLTIKKSMCNVGDAHNKTLMLKMLGRHVKRFKCEYSVACEVHASIAGGEPQWKLTIEAPYAATKAFKTVIFSASNSVAACNAVAHALRVNSASIAAQMHILPALTIPTVVPDITICHEVPLHSVDRSESTPTMQKVIAPIDYDFVHQLARKVFQTLGPGYSETIYHKALSQELGACSVSHEMERVIPVTYNNIQVGTVRADIVIEATMVVELKAVAKITPAHLNQAERYGQLLGLSKIIVINFPCTESADVEVHSLHATWQNMSKNRIALTSLS